MINNRVNADRLPLMQTIGALEFAKNRDDPGWQSHRFLRHHRVPAWHLRNCQANYRSFLS